MYEVSDATKKINRLYHSFSIITILLHGKQSN